VQAPPWAFVQSAPMKLNLLALETSSACCSVALLRWRGDDVEIQTREHEGSQEHAERLLPMVDALLTQAGLASADLQAVAFGQGPGSFTGLRIACGVAQGMALALGIPVIPVASLLAVAAQVGGGPHQAVVVALDARMSEVYLAVYRHTGGSDDIAWEVLQAPLLIAAAEVIPWVRHHLSRWSAGADQPLSVVLAGDAWATYVEEMGPTPGWQQVAVQRPTAVGVAQLAQLDWQRGAGVLPEEAMPLYVRDKVAYTTAERLQGQGGNPKAVLPPYPLVLAPMTATDLDEVVRLEAEVQSFPWSRDNFTAALAAGYSGCVLRREGRLVGFCVLMFAPDVAHLLVVAVAPAEQRRGLGSVLLQWCEEQSRQQKVEGMLLEVRPSNRPAVQFYKRHGFLPIGVRPNYYSAGKGEREDAIMMQKTFTQEA